MRISKALLPLLLCAACALACQAAALARQPSRAKDHGVHRRLHPRAHAACRHPHRHRHCARLHKLTSKPVRSDHGHSNPSSPATKARSPVFGPPAPVLNTSGTEPSLPAAGVEAPPSATTPEPPAPVRVQVIAKEWSFTLSRPEVPAGRVIVEFVNGGEDPHNLHLTPSSEGPEVGSFATSAPRTHTDQAFNMPAGKYILFCSLPGHEAKGMKATLTVG